MAVFRVTAEWTGFSGAPGYSVFHFSAIDPSTAQAQAAADAVGTFFKSVSAHLASGVRVSIQPGVDVLDEASGQVQELLSITPPAGSSGPTSGSYAGPVGAVVHWITGDVRNGRRVRGRNFLVPLGGSAYDSQGTLGTLTLTAIQDAANILLTTTPVLQTWARPSAPGATDGAAYIVLTARVPDKAAVLRSRRD